MNRLNWILLTALVLVFTLYRNSCKKLKTTQSIASALVDSLVYSNDSLTVSISDIQAEHRKNFTKIEGLSGTVAQLQELVKKTNAYNAAVLKNISRIKGASQTVLLRGDTVYQDSILQIYPVYFTQWKGRWVEGKITAKKDTIDYSFKVFNEFELSQSYKREKWYKKKTGVATVKNLNPNTVTRELRTFSLAPKANRVNIGPSLNFSYSFQNQQINFSPGISLQYSLVGW